MPGSLGFCRASGCQAPLPWEEDEGIQTLLSLSLGSKCRAQILGPCTMLSYQRLAPSTYRPCNSAIPWSPANLVLSACPHVEFSSIDID